MPYSVKILADSIAPNGKRLTTWELTYPRFVHAELMTHRLFSRNSASSRAIPTAKLLEQIKNDPAMPVWWGKNQSGMQAREELTGEALLRAEYHWLVARDNAVEVAERMVHTGLHKQIANRILEPWMFITVIMSATELDNWFRLRAHPDAQPEIGWVATEMKKQYEAVTPRQLVAGAWHLPLIRDEDFELARDYLRTPRPGYTHSDVIDLLKKISVARCARVSYVRHGDTSVDIAKDVELFERLISSGHWSPTEHVAQSLTSSPGPIPWSGNFCGWRQYREMVDPNFTKVGR